MIYPICCFMKPKLWTHVVLLYMRDMLANQEVPASLFKKCSPNLIFFQMSNSLLMSTWKLGVKLVPVLQVDLAVLTGVGTPSCLVINTFCPNSSCVFPLMIHAELSTRVPKSFSQLLLLKTHFSHLELAQNSSLKGITVSLGGFALVFQQEDVPSVLIPIH